jgi:TonB dependent receptor
MRKKLIAVSGLFSVCSLGLVAQVGSDPISSPVTVSFDSRPSVETVDEFHAAGQASVDPTIPEAPLPAKKFAWHGEAFGFSGSTPLSTPDLPLRDQLPAFELGGSAGGSGAGGAAYFVSFDQLGFSQQKLESFLSEVQSKTGSDTLPLATNPMTNSAFTARMDKSFGQRDSTYARFDRDQIENESLKPRQGAVDSGLGTDFRLTQQVATAGNTLTISPHLSDQAKVELQSSDMQLPASAAAMGIESNLPTMRQKRIFEAANSIDRQVGRQSIRMGGDFLYDQMKISFQESGLGRMSSGNSFFDQSSRAGQLYVESQRKLSSNLLLTSGINYDLQTLRGFKTDTNNVAPEVGIAWSPRAGTVVRGGAGVYYDQIALPAIAGPPNLDGVANIQNSLRFVSRSGLAPEQLASFRTVSPSMQNAYAEQANFELEQHHLGRYRVCPRRSAGPSRFLRSLPVGGPLQFVPCVQGRKYVLGAADWDRGKFILYGDLDRFYPAACTLGQLQGCL